MLKPKLSSILIHTSVKLVTGKLVTLQYINPILIHTSVKLVTLGIKDLSSYSNILIHTSVKLVTKRFLKSFAKMLILIHTSVKLVTYPIPHLQLFRPHFNPHEREARDVGFRLNGFIF